MRGDELGGDGSVSYEQLQFLAAISTEWEQRLRDRQQEASRQQHERELRQFVDSITGPDYPRRELSEAAQEFVNAITGQPTPNIHEANWNPAKHPRRGGPPNAGWWAPTTNGAVSDNQRGFPSPPSPWPSERPENAVQHGTVKGESSGIARQPPTSNNSAKHEMTRRPEAKTAEFAPSHRRDAYLIVARTKGHHWVPRKVFSDLSHLMEEGVVAIFEMGTEAPDLYYHANDTWNGVKHKEYSEAIYKLLESWIKENGGRLNKDAAMKFLTWIATGKCGDPAFLAKHKELFKIAFKWREGFTLSTVVAANAHEYDPRLTGPELKKIAQAFVNGNAKGLSRRAAIVAKKIAEGGIKGLMGTAKRVIPGLMFLSAAMAAQRGWAGQGHTGSGAWGAANEVARDAIAAELLEKIVFPKVLDTVDGIVNVIVPALNDPTRHRRLWRNGHWINADTGELIE